MLLDREQVNASRSRPLSSSSSPVTLGPSSFLASRKFPAHWGAPPSRQTRDYVLWPAGYGHGSGTVRAWIQQHLDADAAAGRHAVATDESATKEAVSSSARLPVFAFGASSGGAFVAELPHAMRGVAGIAVQIMAVDPESFAATSQSASAWPMSTVW